MLFNCREEITDEKMVGIIVWLFLILLVVNTEAAGKTKATLVAEVGTHSTCDVNFWASKCSIIPETALYVTVHMGKVVDYFKPIDGATFCDMLKSDHKHMWSPDGKNWQQPSYHGSALGGSKGDWPKSIDGRTYLSFWGNANAGGCCHNSKNDGINSVDGAAWHRALDMYYHEDILPASLIAEVGGQTQADVNYWNSKCTNIPSTTQYITVHMGTVIDYFKPIEGATFCEMLKTSTKHMWSPDGENWQQPAYYGGNGGGSKTHWPESIDGRKYLSFWGTESPNGGCCHSSKNDGTNSVDTEAWKQSFKMYAHFLDYHDKFTVALKDFNKKCETNKQYKGDSEENATIKECRDYCEHEMEAYFALWTDHDQQQCSCFSHCDAPEYEENSTIFEILSPTVLDILQTKNTKIAEVEAGKKAVEEDLATCITQKDAVTEEKDLWHTRFETVQELEQNHVDFSEQALQQHPGAEAAVGGENNVKCNPSPTNFIEKVACFTFGAIMVGVGFKMFKDKSEEKLPLLDL